MKKPHLIPILLFTSTFLMAQRPEVKPFRNIIIGNSGSALYENLNSDPTLEPYPYWEYHWTLNVATDISRFWRIGVERIAIYNNFDNGLFEMYGGFLQLDVLPATQHRLFLEANYHRGDFCACQELTPNHEKGLNFFGGATGFDWAISRYFHLDAGFTISWANVKKNEWSVFAGYFLGLDIHLFPPKTMKAIPRGKNVKHL